MLLAGEQQAAVTVAVEGLMDAKPSPELDSFLTFDPKVTCWRKQYRMPLSSLVSDECPSPVTEFSAIVALHF